MGSILTGYLVDVDTETREVTNYEYITDITGLFSATDTPKYIEYNPSMNYIGYTEQTVNYVDSTIPNTYRYIVDSGLMEYVDYTVQGNQSSGYSLELFPEGTLYTPFLINYTGTQFNLGTTSTLNNFVPSGTTTSYNMIVQQNSNGSYVTSLSDMVSSLNTSGTPIYLDFTYNTNYPVLFFNYSDVISKIVGPGSAIGVGSFGIKYLEINDDAFPDQIVINNYGRATAYRNNVAIWSNIPSTQIMMVYDYGTMENGTYTHRNVQSNIHLTSGTYTKIMDTSQYRYFTNNTTYTTSNIKLYYTGSTYNFGTTGWMVSPDTTDTYPLNGESQVGTSPSPVQIGIANMKDVRYTLENEGNLHISTSHSRKLIPNCDLPAIIVPISYIQNLPYFGGYLQFDDSMICDYYLYTDIASHGSGVEFRLEGYKNGTLVWRNWESSICMIYLYETNNNDIVPSSTHTMRLTYEDVEGTRDISIGTGNTYPITSLISGLTDKASSYNTLNYTGTEYNLGSPETINGIDYNGTIPTTMSSEHTYRMYKAVPLTTILGRINIENGIEGTLELTYGDRPVFFAHSSWSATQYYIGNNYTYIYHITVNDNCLPTRLVWNVQGNWVTVYKGDTELYSDSADNINVIYQYESISNNTDLVSVRLSGVVSSNGDTLSSLYVSSGSDYNVNTTRFHISDHGAYNRAYITYSGNQYTNLGIPNTQNIRLANKTIDVDTNESTPKTTDFSTIIDSIDITGYKNVIFEMNYGTRPIFFYPGTWSETSGQMQILGPDNYVLQTIDVWTYNAVMNDNNIPSKLVYDTETEIVTAYRGNNIVWTSLANNICVVYDYDVRSSNSGWSIHATDAIVTMNSIGIPFPIYKYMNPEKGVTLRTASTVWSNEYYNNKIDITVCRDRTSWPNASVPNDLTIHVDTASITITSQNNNLSVSIVKYDGTTETKNLGTWNACQVEIIANSGTISVTPLSGLVSYTSPVAINNTTTTWNDWYNGGEITEMILSTNSNSMRFSVTNTDVFLNTYGAVMQDPSVNVNSHFPDLEEWRLNFYSFALVGDSITVNNIVCPINDETQEITVDNGYESISGELNNIYVTKADGHMYFTFANSGNVLDLGETVNDVVSFSGLWYFTTGLYEGIDGVENYYDWNLDGTFHMSMTQMMLFFVGLLIAGIIICKAFIKLEIGLLNTIIIISAGIIALIIAGGSI